MALDPVKALSDYGETKCTVQFWTAGAAAVEFDSLKAAVRYAKDNGGRWQELEITVHLPREDIVYATEKVHRLIEALKDRRRKKP